MCGKRLLDISVFSVWSFSVYTKSALNSNLGRCVNSDLGLPSHSRQLSWMWTWMKHWNILGRPRFRVNSRSKSQSTRSDIGSSRMPKRSLSFGLILVLRRIGAVSEIEDAPHGDVSPLRYAIFQRPWMNHWRSQLTQIFQRVDFLT
jgi:hypothetical protein